MISVGIDVAKDKSMVCMLKLYGEMVAAPYEITHQEQDVLGLIARVQGFAEEVRVVMEATGAYHLPLLAMLHEAGVFVSVVNPLVMKQYARGGVRKGKSDKLDAAKIAQYGLDNWMHLHCYAPSDGVYEELKYLGRQYYHYNRMAVEQKLALTNLLDRTMPGLKGIVKSRQQTRPTRDKLLDFVSEFWHYDLITVYTEDDFVQRYNQWAEAHGYRRGDDLARRIYAAARSGIATLPSSRPSTQMLMENCVAVMGQINQTLETILQRMLELAGSLPEYETVRAMPGVGDILSCKLIAEIGDVRRFKNGSALVAYSGIDSPPNQSGSSMDSNSRISKRGSAILRKSGYELMLCLKSVKPKQDSAVYDYMMKKEAEGKPEKVAKIAAFNKFLRIYYARVSEVYAALPS